MNTDDAADAGQSGTSAAVAPARRTSRSWAIDFRPDLMEEIGYAAGLALSQFAHGGVEVGGILLGSLVRRTIFLESWLPAACEHAHGPAFMLSQADSIKLQEQLAAHQASTPYGTGPIGWVVSHRRMEGPSEDDVALFNEFLPEPWHVLLVITPVPGHAPHAAFYVRDHEGRLNVHLPYREFDIAAQGAVQRRTSMAEAVGSLAAPAVSDFAAPEAPVAVVQATNFPQWDERPQAVRSPLRWMWLALPALAIAIALIVFGVLLRPGETDEPLDLTLNDANHQLLIRWAVPAGVLKAADFGALVVLDGAVQKTIKLRRDDLRRGSATWMRQTGDVRVDLVVWTRGQRRTGVAEFLGPAPAPVDDGQLVQIKRENMGLRMQAARASARATRAEGLVRILKNRISLENRGIARR